MDTYTTFESSYEEEKRMDRQFMGGYPGMGYGYPGMTGYGGYPGMGYGYPGMTGYGYGGYPYHHGYGHHFHHCC
jgi:hypothetical protein